MHFINLMELGIYFWSMKSHLVCCAAMHCCGVCEACTFHLHLPPTQVSFHCNVCQILFLFLVCSSTIVWLNYCVVGCCPTDIFINLIKHVTFSADIYILTMYIIILKSSLK